METSKVVNVDRQIDCIGLICPMPIVKTREAIRELRVGQVL
ncbi:MAG TPA: sulfurtransferase TusA family protein, partial [Candidatus Binatia bacterium]|nr:sulfurtransferase TusA family protein [Candidatus Binatia bacterium]